jgi:hypothetical protein
VKIRAIRSVLVIRSLILIELLGEMMSSHEGKGRALALRNLRRGLSQGGKTAIIEPLEAHKLEELSQSY